MLISQVILLTVFCVIAGTDGTSRKLWPTRGCWREGEFL